MITRNNKNLIDLRWREKLNRKKMLEIYNLKKLEIDKDKRKELNNFMSRA
jgi:hypothetical protein